MANKFSNKANRLIKTFLNFNLKLILLILLTSISKKQMGCTGWNVSQIDIPACSGPVVLDGFLTVPPSSGDFITMLSSPASVYNNGTNWMLDISIAQLQIGTYVITYSTPGCGSYDVTLNIVSPMDIKVGGTSYKNSTITLSGTFACSLDASSGYTNYRWYKNGFLIPGANSSTYLTKDIGTYTVVADGCYSWDMKAETEVVCDCIGALITGSTPTDIGVTGTTTTYTAGIYNFNGSGGAGGGVGHSDDHVDFIARGIIIIEEDAVINFTNANIRMEAGTQIILEKATNLTHSGGQVNISNSTFTGCNKWAGFSVYGDLIHPNFSSEHASLNAVSPSSTICEISDAYKAVYSYDGGKVNLNHVNLENNLNDITMMHYSFDYTPILKNLTIDGSWLQKTDQNGLDFNSTYSPYYAALPSTNALNNEKMIYLEYINMVEFSNSTIRNCTPIASNSVVEDITAIEMYNVNDFGLYSVNFQNNFKYGIYGNYVSNHYTGMSWSLGTNEWLGDYSFNGNYKSVITFNNSDNIKLGDATWSPSHNYFTGYNDVDIEMNNCYRVTIQNNLFNTLDAGFYGYPSPFTYPKSGIIGNNLSYCVIEHNSFSLFQKAIILNECSNTGLWENNFCYGTNAITMIGTTAQVGNNNRNGIMYNRFYNIGACIIIAPEHDPTIQPYLTYQSNTSTIEMDINILCNYFKYNDICILGCGRISDMWYIPNTNYSAGNKFDSNLLYDLYWDGYGGVYPIKYWCHNYEGTATPNNMPNSYSSLIKPSISINGNSTTNDITYSSVSSPSYVFPCYPILQKNSSFTGFEPSKVSSEIKINNPVNNELIIRAEENSLRSILCYDAIGKMYNLYLIDSSDGILKFDTHDLADGIYFITINNQNLKFIKIQK